jgi:hypothetical protein
MSAVTQRILERLGALGFETRSGPMAPFGEEIPLIAGAAWDHATAQLALVAELDSAADTETWRQLLFAGSALRHHLAPGGPAAFGTPVILAVVDDAGRAQLRELAEDVAQRFVVFNRVDLNLVARGDLDDDDRLDDALAPLLPRCRRIIGQEIAREEIRRFWGLLEAEILKAAAGQDTLFSPYRDAAGRDAARTLIGESAQAAELPAPAPLSEIAIENFRSIRAASAALAPVTIVHGPNVRWQEHAAGGDGARLGRHLAAKAADRVPGGLPPAPAAQRRGRLPDRRGRHRGR